MQIPANARELNEIKTVHYLIQKIHMLFEIE